MNANLETPAAPAPTAATPPAQERIRPPSRTGQYPTQPAIPDGDADGALSSARRDNLLAYLLVGIFFGILATKSEIISWFRIQEMFRFQAIHMYGIIGSAVIVAVASVQIIRRFDIKTIRGESIVIPPKQPARYRYILGGTVFGLGWALLGACPGPIFALIGNGVTVIIAGLLAAVAGTWTYGRLRPHLPH